MQRAASSLLRSLGSRHVALKRNLGEDSWKWRVPVMLGARYPHSSYATKSDDTRSRYSFDDLISQGKAQKSHESKPDYQAADGVSQVNKEPVRVQPIGKRISAEDKKKFLVNTVIKWMLSKGQGTTMGTYEQLICALEKDNRPEEAHNIWVKKISYDLHSVPWRFCDLMLSIYYRNNMLERLVKLFREIESFGRKPPSKSIVRKVADAYEMLGFLEDKNKLLEKYDDLFNSPSRESSRKSQKFRKRGIAAGNGGYL